MHLSTLGIYRFHTNLTSVAAQNSHAEQGGSPYLSWADGEPNS